MYTIALDAMGGDYGPCVVVPAALDILERHDNVALILVGDQAKLDVLETPRLTIEHASEVVGMDEPPVQALRSKRDSSMRVAIKCVKEGRAQACVSAGNTGALMLTACFVLKTLPGIDRPAIIAEIPCRNGRTRVLDLGANVDSTAAHLAQFATMGSRLVSAVDNKPNPTVGLLNIGSEDIKGNEQVKRCAELLSEAKNINYTGFVEGDDIFLNGTDVVVCDGFVGNVALKTSEGTAKLIKQYIKEAFNQNCLTKLVGVLAYPVLRSLQKRLDPARYNGASLVGLNGIVIKSHGGANQLGFRYAIEEAIKQVEQNIPQLIQESLDA